MIDAHVHLWQIGQHDCRWPGPDLAAIHRDFTADELSAELRAHGVGSAIVVQSQESEADTRWLLDIAREARQVAAVIGWVDLTAPDVAQHIDRLAEAGPLAGIRPMVQDRGDDYYDDPALEAGLAHLAGRGLVLDALVRPRHLPALLRLAQYHSALSIVIDHCAKPAVEKPPADWLTAMEALAACPNVTCKLSGLLTELAPGSAPAAAISCIEKLVELFGPDRLIWGSDWPVVTLAGSYGDWLSLCREAVPSALHGQIFAGNAARIYGLEGRA